MNGISLFKAFGVDRAVFGVLNETASTNSDMIEFYMSDGRVVKINSGTYMSLITELSYNLRRYEEKKYQVFVTYAPTREQQEKERELVLNELRVKVEATYNKLIKLFNNLKQNP